jgi:hypothetical protein
MMYIEKMGNVSAGLAATLGENRAAEVITETTSEIAVAKLDEKSRKQIAAVYDQGMKRCKNVGDFDGLFAHLSGKWELVGVDTKDIADVSDQIGKLMGYGRTPFAFEVLGKMTSMFEEKQYDIRLGLVTQAFKNLSKAMVSDRNEFTKVIEVSQGFFEEVVQWVDRCDEKADAIYPILHETMKTFFLRTIEVLKRTEQTKPVKAVVKTLRKMKGESEVKTKMINAAEAIAK